MPSRAATYAISSVTIPGGASQSVDSRLSVFSFLVRRGTTR